ncbi:hypothetical protein SH668x_000500 [Planctomicrobium sp. SH668]|uniref:hypothetical protein n=1 Tax=Planctomicrobium sp. SH668 TaxID=3448126 RepID=UPI003F5B60F1
MALESFRAGSRVEEAGAFSHGQVRQKQVSAEKLVRSMGVVVSLHFGNVQFGASVAFLSMHPVVRGEVTDGESSREMGVMLPEMYQDDRSTKRNLSAMLAASH